MELVSHWFLTVGMQELRHQAVIEGPKKQADIGSSFLLPAGIRTVLGICSLSLQTQMHGRLKDSGMWKRGMEPAAAVPLALQR